VVKGAQGAQGRRVKKEVRKAIWDDRVMALASTPDVLTMMSEKID